MQHLDLNGLVLGVGAPVAVEPVAPRDFPNLRSLYQLVESPMKIRFFVGSPMVGKILRAREPADPPSRPTMVLTNRGSTRGDSKAGRERPLGTMLECRYTPSAGPRALLRHAGQIWSGSGGMPGRNVPP
jgi:hypothetical protein